MGPRARSTRQLTSILRMRFLRRQHPDRDSLDGSRELWRLAPGDIVSYPKVRVDESRRIERVTSVVQQAVGARGSLLPRSPSVFTVQHSCRSVRWIAIVLAAMLALAWQSIVVQTHFHFQAGAPAQSASGADVRAILGTGQAPVKDDPANCPLCHEFAHAGHFISPAPPGLFVPGTVVACLFLLSFTPWARRERSHTWQSRGPPTVS